MNRNPLKRMQNLPDLLRIYQYAHLEVSKVQASRAVDRVRKLIDIVVSEHKPRAVVWGWSGGKDSVALEYILRPFGWRGVCSITQLEYPVCERFLAANLPDRVELRRTHQDLDWLKANPKYLFARDAATHAAWYRMQQQNALDDLAADVGADMVVTGRRRSDGNCAPSTVYTPKSAPTRFAPILDMSHAEVWAILRHFDLPEYPLYALTPTSLVNGTASWPQETGWEIVKAIDHRLYERVRPQFP